MLFFQKFQKGSWNSTSFVWACFIPTHPKLVEVPNFLIVGVLESRVFICQCFVISGVFENRPLCQISALAKESRSRVTVANFEISNFAHFVSPAHQSFTHKSDSDSSVFFLS